MLHPITATTDHRHIGTPGRLSSVTESSAINTGYQP